jgi:hypothetical protein
MLQRVLTVALGAAVVMASMLGVAQAGGGGGISAFFCVPGDPSKGLCDNIPMVGVKLTNNGTGPLDSATFLLRPGESLFPFDPPLPLWPVTIDLRHVLNVTHSGLAQVVLETAPDRTHFTLHFKGFDPGDFFAFEFEVDGRPLASIADSKPHVGIGLLLDAFPPIELPGRDFLEYDPHTFSSGGIDVEEQVTKRFLPIFGPFLGSPATLVPLPAAGLLLGAGALGLGVARLVARRRR